MYLRARACTRGPGPVIRAPLPPRIRFIVKSRDKSVYWNVFAEHIHENTLKCLLLAGAHTENARRPILRSPSSSTAFSSFFFSPWPVRSAQLKRVQTFVVCRAKVNFLLRLQCEKVVSHARERERLKDISLITADAISLNYPREVS